jgi:hypothetical protein
MLAVNPSLTNPEIEQILKSTSLFIDNLNPNYAGLIGAGRLDSCRAVAEAKRRADLNATVSISPICSQEQITADLEVTGGVEPYTYSWSNGATTEDLSGAAPGIYSVTVTDATGLKTTISATIPDIFKVTGVITNATNNQSTGAINLTVSGQAPQSFLWKAAGGFTASTEDISGLLPRKYSVTVKSVNGCKVEKTYSVLNKIRIKPRTDGASFDPAQ